MGADVSGSVNYVANGDAETGLTTGWATYADAAAATPVDGTGGSANVTLAVTGVSAEVLRGSRSFKFSKDAVDRQGQGISYDIVADNQDTVAAKSLVVQFDYNTTTNYAGGDLRVFAYDVANATLLNVTSLSGDGSLLKSDTPSRFVGYFSTVAAAEDYRLILHVTSTNATAYDVFLDSISISPQQVVPGAIVANLETETWVDDQANATTSVRVTRIGNRVFLDGKTSFTGAASTSLEITVPTAYTPDVSTYGTISGTNYVKVGLSEITDVSTGGTYAGDTALSSPTNLFIFWYNAGAATAIESNITSTTPMTWASGDVVNWSASWIVSDWSTGAAMSTTEALFSSAQFTATKNGTQTISSTSATKVTGWTVTSDNLGWWDATNNRFVVKSKGRYSVSAGLSTANASSEYYYLRVYVNGVNVRTSAVSSASPLLEIAAPLDLNANDYIEIYVQSTADASYDVISSPSTWFSVTAQPTLSSYSVYGQFELLSATSSVLTPGATGRYNSMTGNSLTLTPGTWKLTGSALFSNSGSPTYTAAGIGWYGANGTNTGTPPALMTALPGVTKLSSDGLDSASALSVYGPANASNGISAPAISIVRVTQPTVVYLVPFADMTTAANARITAYLNAERLQ